MTATANKLGKRYTCFKCECKFYDLNQAEPLCPRCGADQREDPNPDPREAFLARYRRPSGRKGKKSKAAAPAAPVVTEAPLEDDGEDLLDDEVEGVAAAAPEAAAPAAEEPAAEAAEAKPAKAKAKKSKAKAKK